MAAPNDLFLWQWPFGGGTCFHGWNGVVKKTKGGEAKTALPGRAAALAMPASAGGWRLRVVGERPTFLLEGLHTMTTGIVHFHRVLRAPPERVYRAFLEPDAVAKWLPPYGFTCQVHHMDVQVGGTHKMSFRNFSTGNSDSFGGEYLELVPFEKIRYSDRFDNPNLPGQMTVTVSLRQVSCGTEITIEQEGIPEVIPVEMCYLGWQESLVQLARLVEPEIPD
jgi:uncharacterized protein YndB with AHSA1/START domain